MSKHKSPTIFQSFFPIIFLMGLIAVNIIFHSDDTLGGANQLALFLASALAAAVAVFNGVSMDKIVDKISSTIASSIPAILILLVIGMLSGTWMLSGIVPTMIYYGMSILNPQIFLPATALICAFISIAIGSSWSTVATVGVAFMGIAEALGIDSGMAAGAIISGAYFGDKLSPLSDTTNLASAVTSVPLFTHIKGMMQTSIPSFLVALVIYFLLSLNGVGGSEVVNSSEIKQVLESSYNLSPWLLLLPLVVIVMIVKKVAALTVLLFGALAAAVIAIFVQPQLLLSLSGTEVLGFKEIFMVLSKTMYGSTDYVTGSEAVNALISTRGMAGMLPTIWLIMMAMTFGGVMEAGRFLEKIVEVIASKVSSSGGAVTTAAASSLLFNLTSGDQYLSVLISGRMFKPLFTKLKLKPALLSRTIEDAGTVTGVLIPWNTCGATQAVVLGVATASYAPFAFFCIISPLMSILFAWFKIGKLTKQ